MGSRACPTSEAAGRKLGRRGPSPEFAALTLVLLAGGDTVVRDAFLLVLLFFGIHVSVPNCYVGSGPAC